MTISINAHNWSNVALDKIGASPLVEMENHTTNHVTLLLHLRYRITKIIIVFSKC